MLFLFAVSSEEFYKCSKLSVTNFRKVWKVLGKFQKINGSKSDKKILVLCKKIFGSVVQLLRNFEMRMKTLGTLPRFNLHWSSFL